MANARGKIYLGYEDEIINNKNQALINYSVNKIGGHPDWPAEKINFQSKCPLCGLHRLQILQCYAPLDNSPYHRTLYVFACVNPNCWIQSESWACIRSQFQADTKELTPTVVAIPPENLSWCSDADQWDDNGDSVNGNTFDVDNVNCGQKLSDDDESNSLEMECVEVALGNLQVYDAHNANMSPVQGAVGAIAPPVAAAELEGGDEPDLVCVDTPTNAGTDLQAILAEAAELPVELRNHLLKEPLQFVPKYIYVEEEIRQPRANYGNDNVNELINKYKRENELELSSPEAVHGAAGGADEETYESAAPLHGDALFHAFLCRLREHPGQILRYTREEPPLLGAPLSNPSSPEAPNIPGICVRCGSSLICELQLLPSFSHALTLPQDKISRPLSHLHFLSVLIFTCSRSCWSNDDVIVNETVIFQPEV